MRESPGGCSNTPGARPTGRTRNCRHSESSPIRARNQLRASSQLARLVSMRDMLIDGVRNGFPDEVAATIPKSATPYTSAWACASNRTKTAARSSPGLSAWLVIRSCSQESIPGPVWQETPEPHKQVCRRCDGVAAPGVAGRDRMLYSLGDRLGPAGRWTLRAVA